MTAWRIITQAVHAAGGSATTERLQRYVETDMRTTSIWLGIAARRGMVYPTRVPGAGNGRLWCLTQLGRDWCEGRITEIETKPGGRRWVSTWLASLPRGIRLQAEQPQECEAA